MLETLAASFKDPAKIVIIVLLGSLLGIKFVTPDNKDVIAKLSFYEQKERDEALKEEILREVSSQFSDALKPVMEQLEQINGDIKLGSRWSLEDMAAYAAEDAANGSDSTPDPLEIQSRRLAKERREALTK